jgi:hypothetical protein
MAEDEVARNVDFGARRQGRALWAYQYVLEIELEFFFDSHGGVLVWPSGDLVEFGAAAVSRALYLGAATVELNA